MVLWQIHTLHHLDMSGFGRPFPRHGLQLLFWFSNHCVTFEPDNSGDVMKLVYFVVGNLSTQSYLRSADLPPFVRENLGAGGVSNSDRIIISYQVKTRLVDKVYVTEHEDAAAGRFRSDGTHEVSSQLIRLLQNPQLDLSSLLTQMGYYDNVVMLQDSQNHSVQTMLSMMQNDPTEFFSQAFSRQLDLDRFCSSTNPDGSGSLVSYTTLQKKKKKKQSSKKPKPRRELSLRSSWSDPYRDYYEDSWSRSSYGYESGYGSSYGSGGSHGKGGFSWFLKLILKAGALCLAARCLLWLVRNIWSSNWDDKLLQRIPGWTSPSPSYPRTHIMLDYVY